jgi:hypothetical protein
VVEPSVEAAVIVTGPPTATPLTVPALAVPELSTVAIAVLLEVHVAAEVMSFVERSAKVAVAFSGVVLLTATVLLPVTVIDCSADVLTVNVVVPVTVFPWELVAVAVIVLVPLVNAVANPPEVMLATEGVAEVQVAVTLPVVLPSSLIPLAVNCCVVPTTRFGFAGLTESLCRIGSTKNPWHPPRLVMPANTPMPINK